MTPDRLDAAFAALADPTRRAILARLVKGEASVGELAAPFDMSGPAVSKHLKVLERAWLITRSRRAQTRPCRIAPEGIKVMEDWLVDFRRMWEDRLDAYLQELQGKESGRDPGK